jgi:ADP-ribosylglycohydrolase
MRSDGWQDRVAGVLLGQACGDALGVPYEFAAPPDGPARMVGGGLGPYAPGEWSDDTQMAAVVAEVAAGADLRDEHALDAVADGFERWGRLGASDIGIQTRAVLAAAQGGDGRPAERLRAAAQAVHDRTGRTAGNGALMRTAVVGVSHLDDRDATAQPARAVAVLTHVDPLAAESCVLWCEAVRVAVTTGRCDLLGGLDLLGPDRREQWRQRVEDATGAAPDRFRPNGFTVTALQAAWAAVTSGADGPAGFADGLQAAVLAGDDTDTVAAIAGGLLGALHGASAVPPEWRSAVHGWPGLRADDLEDLARRVASRSSGASG